MLESRMQEVCLTITKRIYIGGKTVSFREET